MKKNETRQIYASAPHRCEEDRFIFIDGAEGHSMTERERERLHHELQDYKNALEKEIEQIRKTNGEYEAVLKQIQRSL